MSETAAVTISLDDIKSILTKMKVQFTPSISRQRAEEKLSRAALERKVPIPWQQLTSHEIDCMTEMGISEESGEEKPEPAKKESDKPADPKKKEEEPKAEKKPEPAKDTEKPKKEKKPSVQIGEYIFEPDSISTGVIIQKAYGVKEDIRAFEELKDFFAPEPRKGKEHQKFKLVKFPPPLKLTKPANKDLIPKGANWVPPSEPYVEFGDYVFTANEEVTAAILAKCFKIKTKDIVESNLIDYLEVLKKDGKEHQKYKITKLFPKDLKVEINEHAEEEEEESDEDEGEEPDEE